MFVYRLSPPFPFPFLAIFFPKQRACSQATEWTPSMGVLSGLVDFNLKISTLQSTTSVNTMTYRNALCLSPPKFEFVFSFSWGHFNSQKELKTMLMQNFGVPNKDYYGMLWYFLEWSISSTCALIINLHANEIHRASETVIRFACTVFTSKLYNG